MKKILIALTLMMVLPLTVMAAEPAKTEPAKECKKSAWLTKDLSLNADQQAKVDAAFTDNETKKKALHDELAAKMKDILTPEQHAKMKIKHDEVKAKHAEMKSKHGCPSE